MKIEEENLNEPQNPQLNIPTVCAFVAFDKSKAVGYG